MADEPVRLPNARQARIPTDKLVRYALDANHERGRHKARVFASALGITAADWRYLHDAILGALLDATVRSTRITLPSFPVPRKTDSSGPGSIVHTNGTPAS